MAFQDVIKFLVTHGLRSSEEIEDRIVSSKSADSGYGSVSEVTSVSTESSLTLPIGDKTSDSEGDSDPSIEKTSATTKPSGTRSATFQGKCHAERLFDQEGGKLSIPSQGVTLTIPPGALEEGATEKISLDVLTYIPPEITLRDDEMLVTNGFQCLPSGLHFAAGNPVKLKMPHCANLKDPQKVQVVMYSWNHDTKEKKPERIVLTSKACRVTQHNIEVSLEHFSRGWFAMIIDWLFIRGKRISVMPFLPREKPPSPRTKLEIRMVNKPYNTNWRDIHDIDENADYQPAKSDDDEMTVKNKDIKITCQLDDDIPILKEVDKSFFQEQKYTVYLRLDLREKAGELFVQLQLLQSELEREIMFGTKVLASAGQHQACESQTDAMKEMDNSNLSRCWSRYDGRSCWITQGDDTTKRTSSRVRDVDGILEDIAEEQQSFHIKGFDDIFKTVVKELHKMSKIDVLGTSSLLRDVDGALEDTTEELQSFHIKDFDDILKAIAKELHKRSDIDDLGKALGFGPADIGRYWDKNQGADYMGTVDMLRDWRKGQTGPTEWTDLRIKLKEAGFKNMADKYLNRSDYI